MKTLASILVLFTIISITSISPSAFAEVTITTGSVNLNTPGCEETDECYAPSEVTIDVGEKIIMTNNDATGIHTFTSYTLEDDMPNRNGIFNSPYLNSDNPTFEWTADSAGEYPYFCVLHPWMRGTIIVQEARAEEEMNEKEMMEEVMAQEMEDDTMDQEMIEEEMNEKEMMEEVMAQEMEDDTMDQEMIEEEMNEKEMMEEVKDEGEGGGCLIATAAYGSELAPQVQLLREIRDNTVMSTESGAAFMTGFNQLYYSFSPTIADMERENPMFQETVRVFITPMMSTLSIMTLAEDGNEAQVVGLGLSIIALNLGMYIAAPAAVGFTISKRLKSINL